MHDTLQCTSINLDEFCKEEDIEACAVSINLPSLTIYPCGPYGLHRASVPIQGCTLHLLNYLHFIYLQITNGKFFTFLNTLDSILNFLHKNTIEIIICGDFNINYLNDNDTKSKLDNLLLSYDLYSTVNFPTRRHNISVIAIDNIFIYKLKYENYSIHPLVIGLSDHDAQIITIILLWITY